MIMPVELEITRVDGTTETVRLPVEMWNLGPDFVYRVPGGARLERVQLAPRKVLPDADRSNDVWAR